MSGSFSPASNRFLDAASASCMAIAGPAIRTSDCIARIAGSMKPQLRKCPMVAGSALLNLLTSSEGKASGSALSVNTAELLDVGERAVAQPADVAPRIDHVVAALEHVAPG